MNSLDLTYFLVLFPNTVILGVRTSPYEFGDGGGEDTIQPNTALIFPISMRTYKPLSPPIFRYFLEAGVRGVEGGVEEEAGEEKAHLT